MYTCIFISVLVWSKCASQEMGKQPTQVKNLLVPPPRSDLNPSLPCDVPPFIGQLPFFQQAQIREIWRTYQQGQDCTQQQAMTFAILFPGEIGGIAKYGQPAPPVANAESVFPIGTPYFIRSSNADVRNKFDDIWLNSSISDSEKFSKMEQLAKETLNFMQLADFNQWIAAVRQQKARMDARLAQLSKEAREKWDQIRELRQKEEKIISALDPKLVQELSGLI